MKYKKIKIARTLYKFRKLAAKITQTCLSTEAINGKIRIFKARPLEIQGKNPAKRAFHGIDHRK